MEQANTVTGRPRSNVTNADSSPDPGLAALRNAMGAYTALCDELAEERQVNADLIQQLQEARRVADTEAGVAIENARLRTEVQRAYVATISVLADAVQAKDPHTHGHCEQVSQYARAASDRLGMTDDEKRVTCYAALLHDVGKIGVSDGVLNKPGPLLPEERKLVEAHVLQAIDAVDAAEAHASAFDTGCGILPLLHGHTMAAARLERG